MGGDSNRVNLITATGAETWPEMSKPEVALRLVDRIAASFGKEAA
jgi:phosphopantothenoylcysteine decarboxylase/phosphopantothenate--cysteine ligase